ncbi:MAG: hypothetical protein ACRDKT_12480 [Actinomycetota bacterium]
MKTIDLRRHTAADGDVLTADGVRAALDIGARLDGDYDLFISSGAQRATQTLACLLAGSGMRVNGGVVVDTRFRSDVEDRWKAAYQVAGAGDIASFERADPDLVKNESSALGDALAGVFAALPDGGRALIVGHSPMQEAAVYGSTGEIVDPLAKGAGIRVVLENDAYRVASLP